MHGRPRQRAGEPPPDKKELAQVAELQKLLPAILENNRTCCYTKDALAQNARLLELNPEFYTAWNYRKRAVQHLMGLESDKEARKRIAQTEFELVLRALKVNPKSYGAWYHRKWVTRLGLSSLDVEFILLKKLLKLDARNFHGWNYRRFAVQTKGVTPEAELLFTTEKINENFSNYSAWHNRSHLLAEISRDGAREEGNAQERLEEEYELVKNSFYTDPDDQSGWFYYSWLLGQTVAPGGTQLNGIWPPAGSQITIHAEKYFSLPFFDFGGLETLPLVLSFSNPVSGVNSNSVDVKIDGEENLLLDWRPVVPSQKYSLQWTTEIMHQVLSRNRNFTVDILVGAAPGIVSQGAGVLNGPSRSNIHIHTEDMIPSLANVNLENQTEVKGPEEDGTKGQHQELWQLGILEREIESLRELLELETNSKWARLTLARLLLAHATISTSHSETHSKEACKHFEELAILDPPHAQYYQHQKSLLLLKELTKNGSSRMRYYEEHGALHLGGLSLSSIGYTERFLGIQRLDLCNNQLRSAHGLEALQLLAYLDLSRNKIRSVTALAPLRELPLLVYVNVSFNEIRTQSVDTYRVLFPSQLTNSKPDEAESPKGAVKGGKLWEVRAVFQGVRWRILNLEGNPAAGDDEFIDALREVYRGSLIGCRRSVEISDHRRNIGD